MMRVISLRPRQVAISALLAILLIQPADASIIGGLKRLAIFPARMTRAVWVSTPVMVRCAWNPERERAKLKAQFYRRAIRERRLTEYFERKPEDI